MNLRSRAHLIAPTSRDEQRRRRIESVVHLTERFLHDLGLVLAGLPDDLDDYVDAVAASGLRAAVTPSLEAGVVLQPDFGEYADLTIDADVLDDTAPLSARVDFEDRSLRQTREGRPIPGRRRRIRLSLLLDAQLRTVLGHSFSEPRP